MFIKRSCHNCRIPRHLFAMYTSLNRILASVVAILFCVNSVLRVVSVERMGEGVLSVIRVNP